MLPNVLIGITLYFLLAVSVAALCFVPSTREGLRRACAVPVRWWRHRVARASASAGSWRGRSRAWGAGAWITLREHAVLASVALAVLVGLPAAMVLWRWTAPPDTYDDRALRPSDARVAALLRGEQLVAPQALPPELFMQPEVERAVPLVRSANREWALLDADFRQRLLVVFQVLRERHGIEAVLIEGYRSPERQRQLQALGPTVTHAGAFESFHQHGLAADVAFLREGRIVISERDPWAMHGYERLGEAAAELGLTWGGAWRSLKDYGHLELRRPGVLRRDDRAAAPAS